jgi:hypothetical protein
MPHASIAGKAPNMRPMQTAPIPVSPLKVEKAPTALSDDVKDIILQRMTLRESPWRIAAYLQAEFRIDIDSDQVLACWNERHTPSTQTGPRQEKESMPIPSEQTTDLVVPCTPLRDPPARRSPQPHRPIPRMTSTAHWSSPPDTSPSQAEAAREEDAVVAMTDEVREFVIERMARRDPPWLIARTVETKFGLVVDREEIIVCWRDRDALPTQTGPRQENESMPILNDEIKEFIVKRIACYETPSRIAAAVRINFGIDIDRRQIFEYNPAGSRPPAQRWIDLHAATRARFLGEVAEIGIAQKSMRLRMLERFAQAAEENNRTDKAAKFLEQAARECGGFYEKQRAAPSRSAANASDPIP